MSTGTPRWLMPEPTPAELWPMSMSAILSTDAATLFGDHPSVMLIVDPADGRIVAANDAAAAFYGWSRTDLAQRCVDDLDAAGGAELTGIDPAPSAPSTWEGRHRLASGEIRDVEVASRPLEVGGRDLRSLVVTDTTARRHTAMDRQQSEEFARSIVTHAPVGIAVADLDGRLVRVNPAMCRITGYPEQELLGREHLSLTHPDDRPETLAERQALHAGDREVYRLVKRYQRRDGSTARVDVASSLLRDADGHPRFQLGVVADVTAEHDARLRAEEYRGELHASRERFEALVERTSDLILTVASDGSLIYASSPTRRFLDGAALASGRLLSCVHETDRSAAATAWTSVLSGMGNSHDLVLRVRRADGRFRHLAMTLTNVSHVAALGGVLMNGRDITDEYLVRSRLEYQASHDGLTGLANRAALVDRLRQLVTDRAALQPHVLVLLDLVDMASINDRLDHQTGDYLLRSVASRLTDVVGDTGLVARTSGDEFGVLLLGVDGAQAALTAAQGLAAIFDTPFRIPDGTPVTMNARFGVALSTQADGTASGLLQDGDLALADARSCEGHAIRLCSDELRARHRRRLAIEHELASTTITDQLELHYQPIVDVVSGRVMAVEALLRWEHPELGRVGPDEFIPIAERTGAIVPIGAWVLQRGCQQLASWDRDGGPPNLCLSLNISTRQLLDAGLTDHLARVLHRTGIPASRVWAEITETAIADDGDATTRTVTALSELGVTIHIDDFGTGYSSLAQLGRFPFNGLKIDRSFVAPLGRDDDAAQLVIAVLTLARSYGLHVVAEGVERPEQRDILIALGCAWAQGYLWSPPVRAEAIPALLAGELVPVSGVDDPDTRGPDRNDTPTQSVLVGELPEADRIGGLMPLTGTDAVAPLSYAALDLVENMLVITDREGSIVYVNKAFTLVTGYEMHEAVGGNPRLLRSGVQDDGFYQELWDGILAGNPWSGELINRRKNGELYTDHMTITPLRDEDGEITHFVAVKRDVSSNLAALTAGNPAGIAHADATGRLVYANERLSTMLGRPFDELLGHGWLEAMEPRCRARVTEDLQATGQHPERISTIELTDGSNVRVHYAPLRSAGSRDHAGVVATFSDVTTETRAVRRLEDREAYTRSILESLGTPTVVVDDDGVIREANRAWRAATPLVGTVVADAGVGADYRHVRGLTADADGQDDDPVLEALEKVLAGTVEMATVDDHLTRPEPTWWEVRITPLERDQGGAVITHTDITLRHQLQTLLQIQASTDPLTGLANRSGLLHHGEGAMARARRSGNPLTVLFIDLDRFKPINDEHGHPAGDQVLRVCADRLRSLVRETDGVARVGGDEFVVVCEDLQHDGVPGLIARIEQALAEPIDVGSPVAVSASIGMVRADLDARLEQLIADADALMYLAKGGKQR